MRTILRTKKLRRIFKSIILALFSLFILDASGLLFHLIALDYDTYYTSLSNGNQSSTYDWEKFQYSLNPNCEFINDTAKITIIIKSAVTNQIRREAIRKTWGNVRRFSDVKLRSFFVVGSTHNTEEANELIKESLQFNDIIQPSFIDAYFNNTIKTVLGIQWVLRYCNRSSYFLFVDDDYLVLMKNVLKFLRNLTYSGNINNHDLFAGYVIQSSPLRHKISKWHISLNEYPFNKWPIYITAGAYIISKKTLVSLSKAFDNTSFMRFDDLFLSLTSLRLNVSLTHCEQFHFMPPRYISAKSYQNLIASHGYGDPVRMENIWSECKSAGYG